MQIEEEIEMTLRAILEYVGADLEYAKHADLQRMLEWLILHSGGVAKNNS